MKAKMKKFRLLLISLSLAAALTACSPPGGSGSPTQAIPPERAGFTPTMTLQVGPTRSQMANATATDTTPLVIVTPIPSNAPIWSIYRYTCVLATGGGTMTMNLAWTDRSNNEDGYKVFRDGQVIATLAPNSTSFVDVAFVATGKALNYSVEAFNPNWQASTSTITNFCQ
jgi:hypothetical protein